jgi:hypothetical protein
VSHNTKIKSEERKQAIKTTQLAYQEHQVEQWKEEGMKITFFKKLIQYRI